MIQITIRNYRKSDYPAVLDFFLEINGRSLQPSHLNWNWARWEWMAFHPYTVHSVLNLSALLFSKGRLVGCAIPDGQCGEAFCGVLPGFEMMLPAMTEYAENHLKNAKGIAIAANDTDDSFRFLLENRGFQKTGQKEILLRMELTKKLRYSLPAGLKIRELTFPEDACRYRLVLWKGFDHQGAMPESELAVEPPCHPNRTPSLCLAVETGSGEFAAHCQCWHFPGTDYAYVEPVCTIPEYRRQGLGRAVVSEALNRCRERGARHAFVLSEHAFYKHLGFVTFARYTFFRK